MSRENNLYTLKQGFSYEGQDWWKWWIWVEGEKKDLDNIDHVMYTLHSTFTNPVRKVEDRASKFRMETEGWGVFTIYARIFLKDKTEIPLEHDLFLEYPDGSKNFA
jgi:transcription initiation factor IIF auxiliary subunit